MYEVYGEKLNGITRPEGLTDTRPEFSWRLRSDGFRVRQEAYRILVSTSSLATVWDSGKVISDQVHAVPYEGPSLDPDTDYLWSVSSFAGTGDEVVGTEQCFSTGITDPSLWRAGWVGSGTQRKPLTDCTDSLKVIRGAVTVPEDREAVMEPCLYFRKTFMARGLITKATAYATAHGIYKFYVNGRVYGDPFAPGYTVYARHLECQRYDITDAVTEGENVLAAIVADGWYTGKIGLMGIGEQYGRSNAFLAQVFVEYSDGGSETVCFDEACRWSTGGYRYADLFVGEKFDARREPWGFVTPDYDDSAWKPVVVENHGYDQIRGPMSEPVRVLRAHEPKALLRTPSSEMVLDVGENVVGYVRARLRGKRDQEVTLEYSETLDENGAFFQNLRSPGQNQDQKDCYVFGVDGEVEYCPRFTFHGFRYVRIVGAIEARLSDFTVVVVGSDLEKTGEFRCSDPRLDQLQANIFRSQQGNMLSIPTDCPQREKAGWTGDMQVYAPTACFNMDVEAFLRKWLHDMRLDQLADGRIPHVIPDIPSNALISSSANASSAGWGDACVIVPYRLYEAYGDEGVLRENYQMMLRWMAYVEKAVSTGVSVREGDTSAESTERQRYLWNTGFHFGDWLVPSLLGDGGPMVGAELTREIAATAMYAYSTGLVAEVAGVLGDDDGRSHFLGLNGKIREAFSQEYLGEDGSLTVHLQGMYVLALQMGLVPQDRVASAVGHLTDLIAQNGGCLDTGFLSVPFLLDVLYDNGRPDDAFSLLFQTKRPSWLYEVGQGATTMWESWGNITEDGKPHCQSYNHFAFGCVGDFIYRRVLGLQSIAPGHERVRIAPDHRCGLQWASGSLEAVSGKVSVSWEIEGSEMALKVEIPPGVTAEVMSGTDRYTNVESGLHGFEFSLG